MIKITQKLILIFLMLVSMCSQTGIKVEKKVSLELPQSEKYSHPVFNPAGNQILLTSPGYKGLWLYDLEDRNLTQLTELRGAGYKPAFSEDGRMIAFRYTKFINKRRQSSLAILNTATNQIDTVLKNKRNLSEPLKFKNNKIVYFLDDSAFVYDLTKDQTFPYLDHKNGFSEPVLLTHNQKLVLLENGMKDVLDPVKNGHYIWTSISPDNHKLLFTSTGKGTYVTDKTGAIISRIDTASAPKWSPDGQWILFTKQKDDGHRITSSDIFVKSADGKYEFQLTATPDKIELHPAWSPTGDKIVYETDNHEIEIVQLAK